MSDIEEMVSTTRSILKRIDAETNPGFSRFVNAQELLQEIENELVQLENGDLSYLLPVYSHYLATGTFSEIYIDEEWDKEYLDTCARMDELYSRLKPLPKKISFSEKLKNLFK